jgi:hypothetical protein
LPLGVTHRPNTDTIGIEEASRRYVLGSMCGQFIYCQVSRCGGEGRVVFPLARQPLTNSSNQRSNKVATQSLTGSNDFPPVAVISKSGHETRPSLALKPSKYLNTAAVMVPQGGNHRRISTSSKAPGSVDPCNSGRKEKMMLLCSRL